MIDYLASHGRRDEADYLRDLLVHGMIQVDETTNNNAYCWDGIVYLNPELMVRASWSTRGDAQENQATAIDQYNDCVWLASILLHEEYHESHGQGFGINDLAQRRAAEVDAWTVQMHWLQSLLTNPNLTRAQIDIINAAIRQCKGHIRDFGGNPNG